MVAILQAKELRFAYPGPVQALSGVDLALEAGELLCVLGPNGAGKSTLLRTLAGLLLPERGEVQLGDHRIRDLRSRERARQLAVVPQFLPALPDLRVIDFVLGGRYPWQPRWQRNRAEDLRRVRDSLAACDAADLEPRGMTELSGGQRQRVLIARALAQDAQVLLVDEPTHSLDPAHQIAVFELLRLQADRGRAVLVVTHDLNLAAQFATRLLLLQAGRVVAEGLVSRVLTRECLEPIYGPHLHFGEVHAQDGTVRPFVLPWHPPAGSCSG